VKLDVGCGGSKEYIIHKTRGDINCDVLNPTYKIQNFIRCDALHLPFKKETFEVVFMYDLIEHLESPLKALQESYHVLKNKGILKLGTPNALYILKIARAVKRGIYSPHKEHISTWGLPELYALLKKAGFKQINIRYETYLDDPHKTIEKVILGLCPFKALKHRQLLACARK